MVTDEPTSTLRPSPAAANVTRYAPARPLAPVTLDLASTAGALPPDGNWIAEAAGSVSAAMAEYPDASALTARLAAMVGVTPAQLLVTAGADEALERTFRAMLAPGDEVILTTPTFEMLPRYGALVGATCVAVPWPAGPLPVAEILAAVTPRTRLVVVVTPNNPTGAIASLEALLAINAATPEALLLVDLAYADYAEVDPTAALLREPGIVVTRTFSKGWGLPGIRVGWAAGPATVIDWLRRVGNPYPVSVASLRLAESALDAGAAARLETIATVRRSRDRLVALLNELELCALPTEANFVCATPTGAAWLQQALSGLGVGIRYLPDEAADRVRISCPLTEEAWALLEHALRTAVRPEAMLFDMDGVLADVSGSYRQAILDTAASFGITATNDDVTAAKIAGNANDDWQLTTALLHARGVMVPFTEVKARFESLYQGEPGRPGLRERETLLFSADALAALAERFRLGIVTGRPRADAEHFLRRFALTSLFAVCVCKEDGPIKPDPFPVAEAMRQLGVSRAWMIGDTPDDMRAARAAAALPVGVRLPNDDSPALPAALFASGAAWVLPTLDALEEILP